MTFDSADTAAMVQQGTLKSVVLHEMGHVLGIVSLRLPFARCSSKD
jgi:hypothetical protein